MYPGDDVLFWYRAKFSRTIDGDTIEVELDQGYGVKRSPMQYRFLGINAPEKRDPNTNKAGVAAQSFLENLLKDSGEFLRVKSHKDRNDKYGGRFLGEIYTRVSFVTPSDAKTAYFDKKGEWTNISQLMIRAGHAIPYNP